MDTSGGSGNPAHQVESATAITAPATGKRQTIVETLEAPMLQEISVEGFARFLTDRKKYESEIAEKNKEDGVSITPASFLVSMSQSLLKSLWRLKYIDVPEFKDVTSEHVREAIEKNAVRQKGDIDLLQSILLSRQSK